MCPNKYERVKLLEQWGLNVPESYLYEMGSSIDLSAPIFERWGNHLSMRTFPKQAPEFESPYYFDISVEEAHKLAPRLVASYNVVVNEPINPRDAKLAGCMMLEKGKPIVIEIARGSGVVVRDVTSGRRIDERYTVRRPNELPDPDLRWAVSEALKVPRSNLVLEFSLYTINIGIKKESLIFWDFVGLEITDRGVG